VICTESPQVTVTNQLATYSHPICECEGQRSR